MTVRLFPSPASSDPPVSDPVFAWVSTCVFFFMLSLQVCSRTLTCSIGNNSITLCGIVLLDPPQVTQGKPGTVFPFGKRQIQMWCCRQRMKGCLTEQLLLTVLGLLLSSLVVFPGA